MERRCRSCQSLVDASSQVCPLCEAELAVDLTSPIVNAGARQYGTLAFYIGLGCLAAVLITLVRAHLDETAQSQLHSMVLALLVVLPLGYALTPGYRGQQGCAFGCSLWMVMVFSGLIVSGILGSFISEKEKVPRPRSARAARTPAPTMATPAAKRKLRPVRRRRAAPSSRSGSSISRPTPRR